MLELTESAHALIDEAVALAVEPLDESPIDLNPFIDLTRLEPLDDVKHIILLCDQAREHQVASVCVYPTSADVVKRALADTSIGLTCVANFPGGNQSIDHIHTEIERALNAGATEIDFVFPYEQFLRGDFLAAEDTCVRVRRQCEDVILKIILESGRVHSVTELDAMCDLAIHCGADFLKTSTGKAEKGASLDAAYVILCAIERALPLVGFKASGGIKSRTDALAYYHLTNAILGDGWAQPSRFRIGTSRLLA